MNTRTTRWLKRFGVVAATAATLAVAAPMAANAAAPETTEYTYKGVVFNEVVKAFDGHAIHAFTCPVGAPYLTNTKFHDHLSRNLFKGIHVEADTEVAVSITWAPRIGAGGYVVGWGEDWRNSLFNNDWFNERTAKVTAHCTDDINKAYRL